MQICAGTKLLRERYSLVDHKLSSSEGSESWIALGGEDERKFFVRLWPYSGDDPPDLLRALWDAELRTLYRVASAPGAEETILVIRDAGLDRSARCFVMVLEADNAGGYEPLSVALNERQLFSWLQSATAPKRRDIWQGLVRIAEGIVLLHDQNILHRNIEADCVLFNRATGLQSLRLGGFEWSIRLGVPESKRPAPGWSSPPEFFKDATHGFRPETDWYAFGILAARCVRSLENYAHNSPLIRHQRVMREVENAASPQLSDLEKNYLIRLIAEDPDDRLNDPKEILTTIDDIVKGLGSVSAPGQKAPLLIGIDPKNIKLLDAASALDFIPNPGNPDEQFNPRDNTHIATLCEFISDDLNKADPCMRLSSVLNQDFFVLEGNRLILTISEFEFTNRVTNKLEQTWDLAFCIGSGELRNKQGSSDLIGEQVVVRPISEIRRQMPLVKRSWRNVLPRIDPTIELQADLAKFHNFIRCTNQLELLIRDAEIFAFELVGDPVKEAARVTITIREVEREKPPIKLFQIKGGLAEFLQREITSGKQHSRRVIFTSTDSLVLAENERSNFEKFWSVQKIDRDAQLITLYRVADSDTAVGYPNCGYIRAWGMFGQVSLVRRRKRAIDRLEKHSFLLRSLSSPAYVYMDTGATPLPSPVSPEKVDVAKRAALEDILRVRPIYALQGPPGTGKTTLVAHLLRQIFSEDPVAQVLITAQAHGAVDVLREKVRTEAFLGVAENRLPLAVRIGTERDEDRVEGTVRYVAADILSAARERLSLIAEKSLLQDQWLTNVEGMLHAFDTGSPWPGLHDFSEVVKKGASITYCTTSAGDLEVLAESTQSFDWAIVEEAGKAYAFDLALPLQMGHRWLLIGDHKQLPPYQFQSQLDGVLGLEQVVEALNELTGIGPAILDTDWIKSWGEMPASDQSAFKQYSSNWLNAFERIFLLCSKASGSENFTSAIPTGAASGRLTEQHRMHPTIGTLVSTVFYDGGLTNSAALQNGRRSAVTHRILSPSALAGKPVVWLNTVWAAKDEKFAERGPLEGAARYTNPAEAEALLTFIQEFGCDFDGCKTHGTDVAVLAPYTQQVALINELLPKYAIPSFLSVKNVSRRGSAHTSQIAHTVDSFQGNQADIVCISLVRNNKFLPGEGLGFLKERPRVNVLLSRAKQLLVLVGSWEFFEHQVKDVSLKDESNLIWHWKKTLSLLQEWFAQGSAVRIDVT